MLVLLFLIWNVQGCPKTSFRPRQTETNDVIAWLNDDFYTAHWPQARTEGDGTKREREVTNNILQKKIETGRQNVTLQRVRGVGLRLVARRSMHEKRHKILGWL